MIECQFFNAVNIFTHASFRKGHRLAERTESHQRSKFKMNFLTCVGLRNGLQVAQLTCERIVSARVTSSDDLEGSYVGIEIISGGHYGTEIVAHHHIIQLENSRGIK